MKLTIEQQIENCVQGLALLDDLPDEKLSKELRMWCTPEMEKDVNHCGAAACFGGWVALHPHFQKYGVYPSRETVTLHYGQPRTRRENDSDEISMMLFGNEDMFGPMYHGGSEKKEIRDRLEDALDELIYKQNQQGK